MAPKKKDSNGFHPRIVVFACNWCSYAGADLAGVSRLQYPADIRVIRTMCSGRVNPAFILKAFKMGADGVLWTGCHFGDCHYMFGNYRAEENYQRLAKILDLLGIEKERYGLEWISAAEGQRWSRIINEFVENVQKLGPKKLGVKS
ncbi:MAG: hydrogenase iron-sulfur subunit [Acidobacteria bacterium]|nr:hydrogenase iron-sulfur subunit [Acidobacteriota bacterium]